MQFNFNFEAFEKSGKDKQEAINYLKNLNSSIDFDKLESEAKGDNELIYNALKIGNFSFSKPSVEEQRQKFLKNKENEALKAEFHASTSWLDENQKENYNFYDFKKAKEFANSKAGKIEADLKASEKELERKKALYKKQYENADLLDLVEDSILQNTGLNYALDVGNKLFKGSALENKDYISSAERANIEKSFLQSARQKVENGAKFEDLEALEKRALSLNNNEADREKAFLKEKEKQRLIQKGSGYSKAEIEFMEEDLGFFHTLFNDDKETKAEFKDKYFSEGVIKSEVQRAVNTLKQFDESELLKNIFADKKESEQLKQKYLSEAYKIAELSGFDDVGLSKENELYFIKKDEQGNEQKYKVNTGFLDNFTDTLLNAKFEIAAGITGALAGAKKGKTPMAKALNSIAGGAAGSLAGALTDAKLADMALNRESDFKRNLDYAIQAGVLSVAGDGVMLAAPTLYKKGVKPLAKGAKNFLENKSVLGFAKTIPTQNISAAESIINEVFTPEMKAEIKEAQEKFGVGVKGEDLANPIFSKLEKEFGKKYGKDDEKTQKIAKLAEIFNANSLKTRQQEMLDLVRSDKDGSTLAYLLEVAKDDVKIQQNLKNMLNIASFNVEKNLKNLNIKESDIKSIMDEFESGNKAAFKEVESQISKLYDDNFKVVLDKGAYESVKEEFLKNGVNLDEATPFLKDIENNVFSKEGVTFTQLNNFRKNLNYYIFNKDKSPNFINSVKKVSENILKSEIDKGIDNIFNEIPSAYESIKELYSTSLKDYAAMKELNESVKKLGLQDKEKTTDEVVKNLIKFAKGQGEADIGNLDRLKNYLGEENNAFLEMQILNRLFKESIVENERAKVRVIDSESFLNKVKELVGEREVYDKAPAPQGAHLEARALSGASSGPSKQANFIKKALNQDELKKILESWDLSKEANANAKQRQIISQLSENEADELRQYFNFKGKKPIVREIDSHQVLHTLKQHGDEAKEAKRGQEAVSLDDISEYENIVKNADFKHIQDNGRILYAKQVNGHFVVLEEVLEGQDKIRFFDMWKQKGKLNEEVLLSHSQRPNTNLDQISKRRMPSNEQSITQPFFKSKEAREFLELIEGFHTLYKNDASIAKAFTQGTASHLSTSIATTAEGAIKQKVVKGAFDPIFRLLPEGILFGMFSKQIQGGALRYHLRKALSRSLNYDDFKIKLEKQLSKSKFNNATLRLIDSFMQNLEDFNKAKEAKLAQKEAKRKAELEAQEAEAKRIKAEQNAIYEIQAQQNLKDILESDEPLKDFGTNYGEFYHNGKGAVEKLLKEQSGQVQGAFYREELGDIDLVWGDDSFGLKHIIDKHGGEFENLAEALSEIMEKGSFIKQNEVISRIEFKDFVVELSGEFNGEKRGFIITAFKRKPRTLSPKQDFTDKSDNALSNHKEAEAMQTGVGDSFTDEPLAKTPLSSNQNEIIPQNLTHQNTKELKKFEKELFRLDEYAYNFATLNSTGAGGYTRDYEDVLRGYFDYKHINLQDFKKLKSLNKASEEYQNLLKKMYLSQQEIKKNIKILENATFDEALSAAENYIKTYKNFTHEQMINERKRLLTIPLENNNMKAANLKMLMELEALMYPNMRYFKENSTIYTFLRNGENFNKSTGVARKLSLQEFETYRKMLEKALNIKPNAEFGTNYAEFYRDGKGAVKKLIKEAQAFKESGEKGEFKGQVSGAFYREELGDIDLVWGDDSFGLKHIIDKHGGEFEDIAEQLSEIVTNGVLEKGEHRYFIKHDDYRGMIALDYKGKESNGWILTLYKDKSALNPAYQHQIKHNTNTSSETRVNGEFENSNIKSANLQKEKVDEAISGDAEVLSAQESAKNQALKTTTRETEKFMQLAQDLQNKSLSKNDKIQIIDNLVSALSSLEDKMPEFIEEIMKKANKATMPYASAVDRAKYKGFNASDKYAMFEAFRVIKLLDAYDDAEKLIKDIKKGKDIDFNNKIFKKMQNTEKALVLNKTQASLGVRNDFENVLKNHEQDVNLLIDKALKLLGDKKIQNAGIERDLEAKGGESKTKLDKARVNLSKIDEGGLSNEQKELLKLFKGEIKSVKIQAKDLKDIYTLKQGSRKEGAKKILIKHYGEEKTGGLSDEELLKLKEVIKKGEINLNSLEIKGDILRYGYDYEKDGVKLRVVVDDYKDGKKIFDYYSDRNFNHYEQGGYKPDLPTPSEIIPQKSQQEAKANKRKKQNENAKFLSDGFYKDYAKLDNLLKRLKNIRFDEQFFPKLMSDLETKLNEMKAKYPNFENVKIGDFKAGNGLWRFFIDFDLSKNSVYDNFKIILNSSYFVDNALAYRLNKSWDLYSYFKELNVAKDNNPNDFLFIKSYPSFKKELKENKELEAFFKQSYELDTKEKRAHFLKELKTFLAKGDEPTYQREAQENKILRGIFLNGVDRENKPRYDEALRLIKKQKDIIESEKYKENLKAFGEGGKHSNANDGMPYLSKKGFYYNDKALYEKGEAEDIEVYEDYVKKMGFENAIEKLINRSHGTTSLENLLKQNAKHILNDGTFSKESKNVLQSNQHIGAGLLGGSLNGIEQDENGNISFNPQAFLLGFLGGAAGSKALSRGLKYLDENPAFKEKVKDEIAEALKGGYETLVKQYPLFKSLTPFKSIMQTEQGRKAQAQSVLKKLEYEQKGIYNVAFNGKNASVIKQDLESVESAIAFMQGTRYKGAKHERIKHLSDANKQGYITDLELVNLGQSIREFLKHNEPFIDTNGARIYEWENKDKVRFRVVVNDVADMDSNPTTATKEIITFYSDRNLKEKMQFKNPMLKKQKITDKAKMQEERKKEDFYNVFSLQDVLSDDFIKENKLGDTYYGSINIGEKLKQGEYNIIGNQLYISKDDFDKNKISDEAINDFLLSLGILGDWEAKGQLYKAQEYAYWHKMPLNLAKENIIQEAELEKTIPLFKEAKEKFKEFEPRKIKDLLEWHKDSSLLTKDENGVPKVFYHGSDSKHNVFEAQEDQTNLGFFFSTNPKEAREYGNKFYKVFLKIKNPFLSDEVKIKNEKDLQKWADFLEIEYPKNAYNDFLEMKDYFDDIKARGQSIGLMLSESDSWYANFIDKSGKYINVNLTNLEKAPYKIQQAFKDFKHIADRDNGIGFKNSGASHNFLNWARNDFDLILMALDRGNLKYGEYERWTQKSLKDLLKTKGYDGIKFNDFQYSVFDSNQIKHIDNKGGFVDEKGKITKTKPKNKEAEHKYFNENSENIYYSNPHIGAGLLGGTLNGVEQDEEGNLSFDPAKFAAGFLGANLGSKAVAKGLEWRARKVAKSYPNIAKNNPVLMSEIAKRDLLTYAKNESANALTRFLNKNKPFDSIKGIFAGEKALLNEAYAPHKARLAKAKELESNGADEIEIWEKTGWYKDKDKKWKFEISQRGGEFDYKLAKKITDDMFNNNHIVSSGRLKEVLQDKELFQAYPELQDLRIEVYDLGINGKYDNSFAKTIILNNNLDSSEAISTLYHEIQHAIQDIEGFAYGEHFSKWSKDNYRLRHGEAEARNVQKRLDNGYIGEIYSKQSLKDEIQNLKDLQQSLQKSSPDLVEVLDSRIKEYEKNYKNLGEYDIYNTRRHPYKTMDTPLKDTIAQSTMRGEALSKELEREQKENLQNTIRQNLQNLPLNNKPLELSEKQVKLLINRFANARNLKEHLNTRTDNRKELYALLNDTLENPQIHFIKEGRDKYLKRYKGGANEPYFYLLITQDKDKIFITHLKTRDIKYLSRQISNAEQIKKGADIIEALSQRAGDDKASASKKDYSK